MDIQTHEELDVGINVNDLPKVDRYESDNYVARLALDDETKMDAYRLRYESYLSSGHIKPNSTGLFVDEYDAMPNNKTIVVYKDTAPIASVRVCLLVAGTDQRSPASDAFPEAVDRLMKSIPITASGPGRISEYTRLVRSPLVSRDRGLVFLLYRIGSYVAMMSHAQIYVACVRKGHVSFYRRLGYRPETEPRAYPGLSCLMQLMSSSRARFDDLRAAFPVVDPFTSATGPLDDFLSGGEVNMRFRSS